MADQQPEFDSPLSNAQYVTAPLQAAIAEAEQLIRSAEFIRTEQDLLEGLDYLSGRIRMAMQMAFDHDLTHPILINPTHQYSRQGLDNPDALYRSAYLVEGGHYLVEGERGTTSDLSFQVMDGTYGADRAPAEGVAFDDRELQIRADGTFSFELLPHDSNRSAAGPDAHVLPPGAKTLIIREVFNDWDTENPGRIWLRRLDTIDQPTPTLSHERITQRYQMAAKMLVGSIKTWFAFPQFFTYPEPVNTLTSPKTTPGGLPSQYSSIGHYELRPDQALVVTLPYCEEAAYQAIQIGSDWYVSTDYEGHQSSLTKAQAHVDPDGLMRFVISEQNPQLANWLEVMGHPTGVMMLRWQRLTRALTEADGPRVEVVNFDELVNRVPYFDQNQLTESDYAERIQARRLSVARRMLS